MELYSTDMSLPGIPTLLDPGMLRESVGDWLEPGELQVVNIRYKPNTSCLVSYCLQNNGERNFIHAKSFLLSDWPVRRKKIADSVWLNDELAFAVYKFPDDNKLAALPTLQKDPDTFLSRVFLGNQQFGKVTELKTLAYKPNRRFVASVGDENQNRFVLKLHCKSTFKSASAAASTIKKLGISGLPNRIGRSKRHRALAYQWIDGSAFDFAKCCDLPNTIDQIFGFLGQIQRPVDTTKCKISVRSRFAGVRPIAKYLELICSPLGKHANQLLQKLIEYKPHQFRPLLAHGDFYDRQLLVRGDRLFACDFDEMCVDDSTADIANFVANLRLRNALGELDSEIVGETDGLFRKRLMDSDSAAVRRYLWYQSVAMMRLATHPFRAGNTTWVEQVSRLLQVVDQIISELQTTTKLVGSEVSNRDSQKPLKMNEDLSFVFLKDIHEENATEILKEHVPRITGRYGNFAVESLSPIRHKRGRRCLIEFELATDQGLRSILGKVSAKRLDKKGYNTQRSLFKKHGFSSQAEDGICTPRTFGCVPSWHMWLQEKVEATTASDLMASGNFASVVDRVPLAIHKLHCCNFVPHRIHSLADEMMILSKRLSQVMISRPELALRVQRVLEQAHQVAGLIDSGNTFTPIHRDFYQDQILFSPDRTYLIDLDLVASGPPALDVGNFLAHLSEHSIRLNNNPFFWIKEEQRLLSLWLKLETKSSEKEVAGYKALSFARHISISQTIQSRCETTLKIIEHTEFLIGEFLDSATRTSHPVNSIRTGELI